MCRQVHDALSYALAEVDDPLIDDLVLASVVPAPTASRVEITLVPSRQDGFDFDAALARLHQLEPGLRADVAAEVCRKRVPVLVFRIVHPLQVCD
ncbi:MAG: hypothetical protein NT062_31330 [Proteobacteria bacterium]|nr:hypothetical protein [Pseudomonadota bacterium]